MLLRNREGHILLVKPVYKDGWEIPGGLVEAGESPREAVVRECEEEIGVTLTVDSPVCVHYMTGAPDGTDGVMFVFDAGTTDVDASSYPLPPDELSAARFVAPADLDDYLPDAMARRMRAAGRAVDEASGGVAYLER